MTKNPLTINVTHDILLVVEKNKHINTKTQKEKGFLFMNNNNTVVSKCQGIPADKEYKFFKEVWQGENIVDTVKMTHEPKSHIKKISKTHFRIWEWKKRIINKKEVWIRELSHDVFEFENHKARNGIMSYRTLRKKFVDLRQLIATNFSGAENEIFITLTYEGEKQTNDSKQIHNDFRKFFQRLKRDPKYADKDLGYIVIVEPHASGNWHLHLLLKSMNGKSIREADYKALGGYLCKVWGQGYVKAEELNCDHIGAYFIAYLSGMELSAAEVKKYQQEKDIIEKNGKKYIKGERLKYYPEYMKIYRQSYNIIQPTITKGEAIPDNFRRIYNESFKFATADIDFFVTKEQYKK